MCFKLTRQENRTPIFPLQSYQLNSFA